MYCILVKPKNDVDALQTVAVRRAIDTLVSRIGFYRPGDKKNQQVSTVFSLKGLEQKYVCVTIVAKMNL